MKFPAVGAWNCSGVRSEALDLSSPLLADNGTLHQATVDLFAEIFAGQFRMPLPAFAF